MQIWRILLLLLLFSVSGCFAHKVHSPILTTHEHPEITAKLRNVVLAIEYPNMECKQCLYRLDKVIENLQNTGLFQEVGYRERLTRSPDLILTSLETSETDVLQACNLGFEGAPLFTIGSIGLIPQICHTDYVISFQLYRFGREGKVDVRLMYETGYVVGWIAIVYNLSPKWTWMPQPQEKKLKQVWKAAFWKNGDDILEILR